MPNRERKLVVSIEDDAEFVDLLRLMLKSDEVDVVHAADGQYGLRMVEDLEPDLVVLDLMMPGMHGWQVFEQMQRQERLRDIPVIVVTALSSEADRSFGLEVAGVSAYLVKPIRPAQFRTMVFSAIQGKASDTDG